MKTGRWGGSWGTLAPLAAGLMLFAGCDEPPVVGGSGGADEGATTVTAGAEIPGVAQGVDEAVGGSKPGAGVPGALQAEPVATWDPEAAGFARYLPVDTSSYTEVRKLGVFRDWLQQFKVEDAAERVEGLLESPEQLQKMAEELGADGVNDDAVEQLKAAGEKYGEDAWSAIGAIFSEEVFMSLRGVDWWLELGEGLEKYVVEYSGSVSDLRELGEDSEPSEEQLQVLREMVDELRKKFAEVDDHPVLGVQFGGKVAEDRDELVRLLNEGCEEAVQHWDAAKAHSFKKGGTAWTGFKVVLEDLVGEDRNEWMEQLEEHLKDAPDRERVTWAVNMMLKQELVVAFGEVDDYVVFYIGLGEQSLEVVTDPSQSLAGREEMQFLAEFPLDGLLAMSWEQQEVVDLLHRQNFWETLWMGAAEAAEESDDLEAGGLMAGSARKLAELAKKRGAGTAHASVKALALHEGLRLETRGGWLGKELDLESPLKLAGAMQGRDKRLLMRAHWKESGTYTELGVQQFEEVVNMVRLIGEELQAAMEKGPGDEADEADGEDGDGDDKQDRMVELYRTDFVRSVEDLWDGYREHFLKAVDGEVAMMVDLDGEAPPVAGVDEEVLENGRIPRFAYLRPVKDRDELQETWRLWRGSGVRMLGMLSEAVEQPIPFPDTMSADKNDLRTHFFSMPFATDDFLPSVSVSDELFVVGTSKRFSEELYETIVTDPSEGEPATGVIVEISGSAFWDFCDKWLEVSLKKGEILREMNEEFDGEGGEAEPTDEFREFLEESDKASDAADEEIAPDDGVALEDGDEAEGDSPMLMDALTGGASWDALLRQGIEQARWFRGASYRKWLDGGVPRSSTRIHWGDPAELAE